MPIVKVLVGVPASGKSTWTEQFLSKQNRDEWVVLSLDNLVEEYAKTQGKTYDQVWKDYVGVASKKFNEQVNEAFSQRKNVIWDQTNLTVKKRRDIFRKAKGYDVDAVVFVVQDSILESRLKNRPGKTIPGFVLRNMRNSYVSPSKEEGFRKIETVRF